jgi:hypothetical protein
MNWRIDFENAETERNLLIIENQKLKGLLAEAEKYLYGYAQLKKYCDCEPYDELDKFLEKIGESHDRP